MAIELGALFTIANDVGFELPPPGAALTTRTVAVPAVATSAAEIAVDSFVLLMKTVFR